MPFTLVRRRAHPASFQYSRLVMIKLSHEWAATAWMPPNPYDWDQFISPAELRVTLARNDQHNHDTTGMSPGVAAPALFRLLRELKKGRLTYAEFGRRASFVPTNAVLGLPGQV